MNKRFVFLMILLVILFSFLIFFYTGRNSKIEINKLSDSQKSNSEDSLQTCEENWVCGEWLECDNKIQTRNCWDKNSCGTSTDKPIQEQECESLPGIVLNSTEIVCIESWGCSDWSLCNSATLKQSRDCTDKNECRTLNNQPPLDQSCECTSHYEKRCTSSRTMYWFDSCNRTERDTQETCNYTYKCENAQCISMNCDEISGTKCLISLCTGAYFNMADTTPPIVCCKGDCLVS